MDNEVDNNFILLRKKLDILGFSQPLPISAYALVSAILDDLVKTTDSLKRSKQEISQLLEVRSHCNHHSNRLIDYCQIIC